jgi:hypothetical protein
MSQPLYPQGKSPWHPPDRRPGEPQSKSGRGGEEKNSHALPRLEPPIIQPVGRGKKVNTIYETPWIERKFVTHF